MVQILPHLHGCDFKDFVREDTDDDTFIPSIFSDFGTATARLIWDWSTGTFIGMTNVAPGFLCLMIL